jgi:single-strand DNA-binding protein
MNEIQVTVRGNVASEPRQISFDDGNILTNFRLASNARYFDRTRQEWVDRGTTFVSVICRRALAANVSSSVTKGNPVVVTGRLRDRLWTSNDRSGRTLEIEADTLGHDLSYGTTAFVRIVRTESVRTAQQQAEDDLAYQVVEETREAQEAPSAGEPLDVSAFAELDEENPDDEELDEELDEENLDDEDSLRTQPALT